MEANLILPTEQVVALSPFHTLTKTTVNLKPGDAHQLTYGNDPDFMPSKAQIEALLQAASARTTESRELLPAKHENIVTWQAELEIEKPDGKKMTVRRTYELDLRHSERDGIDGSLVKQLLQRKWDQASRAIEKGGNSHYGDMPARDASREDWAVWVRDKALRELEIIDRFRIQRAETGAILRCGRSMLNLKSSYKRAEIERPFVVYSASFDVTRALQYGGPIAELAMKAVGSSLASRLGMPEETIAGLLQSAVKDVPPEHKDLLPLADAEVDALLAFMQDDLGIKDRRQADAFAENLYGEPVSRLTKRHARRIHESAALMQDAKDALEGDDMAAFKSDLRQINTLAYADGSSLLTLLDQKWYDEIYGEKEEDQQGEVIEGECEKIGFGDAVESSVGGETWTVA